MNTVSDDAYKIECGRFMFAHGALRSKPAAPSLLMEVPDHEPLF
jgi:hypothetical protein